MKSVFEAAGVEVHTAERLVRGNYDSADQNLYISIGDRAHWPLLKSRPNVRLSAYFQLEPPAVDPAGYKAIPQLLKSFETVYTHDPGLFGHLSLRHDRLQKLYWPQVRDGFVPCLGDRGRERLCIVNGNKQPHVDFDELGGRELYSERIRAITHLEPDIYGPGWNGRKKWKGAPADKFQVLSGYDFCICFENQAMSGYVTEKIFECMFAGCVPIYLGAPDITRYVPRKCFVDMRDLGDYDTLRQFLANADPEPYRQAMAAYFKTETFGQFTCQHFAKTVVERALQATE